MSESIDQEVEAIKAVLTALAPLSEKARASVLDYVVKRLSVQPLLANPQQGLAVGDTPASRLVHQGAPGTGPVHIKTFKEGKRPRSANEMAALVAYYLANLAPPGEKKATLNQQDIETFFKIAGFPLPKQVRVTLQNAKNAGYFDLVGDGQYKLNAVGHNLVVHSMPRGKGAEGPRRSPHKRGATPKNRG